MRILPRLAIAAIISFGLIPLASAKDLNVTASPPQGWSADSKESQKVDPRIEYTPPSGRDASFTVRQIGRVGDALDKDLYRGRGLEFIHAWWFKATCKENPAPGNLEKLDTPYAKFLISVYEDPKLKGKPIVAEDYKYVTVATGVVGDQYYLSCVLLSQERNGVDLEEVRAALKKIKLK